MILVYSFKYVTILFILYMTLNIYQFPLNINFLTKILSKDRSTSNVSFSWKNVMIKTQHIEEKRELWIDMETMQHRIIIMIYKYIWFAI